MRSGGLGQAQVLLQLVEGPGPAVVVGAALEPVPGEGLLRVAGDGGLQGPLGAPLRHPDLHPRAAHLAQPLGVQAGLGGHVGHQHQLGPAQRVVVEVEPLQRPAHQLGPVELLGLVDHEPPPSHHPAPPHEEHLHGRLQGVLHQADHVEVLVAGTHHLLGLHRLAHRVEPVPQTGGPLVLHLVGRGGHLGAEALDHRVGVALQEAQQLGHHLGVVVGGHLPHARPRALLDVVQQAGACPGWRSAGTCRRCRCGSGRCAAAGRGCRGWRRRGRRGRSSGCPCGAGPRMTMARGHSSRVVTHRNGYDLSSV